MKTVTPENSERNAYIDVAMSTMDRAFKDSYVQRSLGELAYTYSDMLDTAFIPNIVNGRVQTPEDTESDGLPIIAIGQSETVTMDDYYHTQTRHQRTQTLSSLASWAPRYDTQDIYDALLSVPSTDSSRPRAGLGKLTLLMVIASSNVLLPGQDTELFENLPSGTGMIKKRPVLILGIDGTESQFSPMIGHELEHVRQFEKRPVMFVRSQNHANMQALRGELKAANVGSGFAAAMIRRGGQIEDTTAEGLAIGYNLGIDMIRKAYRATHGFVSTDPFEPSGGLFKELTQQGFGAILHEAVDYAALQELIRRT